MWFGSSAIKWSTPSKKVGKKDGNAIFKKKKKGGLISNLSSIPTTKRSISITKNQVNNSDKEKQHHHDFVIPFCEHESKKDDVRSILPPTGQATQKSKDISIEVTGKTYYGHTGAIQGVIVKDDRFIATCSSDSTIKIWSRGSMRCLHTLKGHSDVVSAICVNSTWLVSASHDASIKLWDYNQNFKLIKTMKGHSSHVNNIKMIALQIGKVLISSSEDATLRAWELPSGLCLKTFNGHASRITCFAIVGMHLCSGSVDSTIRVWSLSNGIKNSTLKAEFKHHKRTIQKLENILDTKVLSSSNDCSIRIFDLKQTKCIRVIRSHIEPVYCVKYLHSNGSIISGGGDGRVFKHDLNSFGDNYSVANVFKDKWISQIEVTERLIACTSENNIVLLDTNSLKVVKTLETPHCIISTISWINADKIFSSGNDGSICIWDIASLFVA